ncbi:hypothetical protein [Dyadobacter sp. NIV53]|uniref:hypothetical protein n=1 Tax=Dyadobacter sp. NIV53 TaxID=2861765 RepID=UPI001C867C3E|nr:hypothetical protein [Dyadobacter sp. NIV53]
MNKSLFLLKDFLFKVFLMLSLSAILTIFTANNVISQNTLVVGRIKVGQQSNVYKQVKITGCEYTYKPQVVASPTTSITEVIKETKTKDGETEITVKEVLTYKGTIGFKIKKDTTISINYKGFAEGKADFYLDEKDKSKLYISYWLNKQHKVDKSKQLKFYKPIYDCTGKIGLATFKRTLS